MKYIVVALPVVDYPVKGNGPIEQRSQLYFEIERLSYEAESKDMEVSRLLEKYYDVGQAIAGLIRSRAKETLAGQSVDKVAFDVFERANTDHLKKMERYAEERGWAILSGNPSSQIREADNEHRGRAIHPLSRNNTHSLIKQ